MYEVAFVRLLLLAGHSHAIHRSNDPSVPGRSDANTNVAPSGWSWALLLLLVGASTSTATAVLKSPPSARERKIASMPPPLRSVWNNSIAPSELIDGPS